MGVLGELDSLESSSLPAADRSFLFCQRSDSISGHVKEKQMTGETQVELSHTCFGTDFDPFALFGLVWNSRST